MEEPENFEQKMHNLQKMRVALIILLSQETSKMLSRQQRAGGKALEVMCAERDLESAPDDPLNQTALTVARAEERIACDAVSEIEREIARMNELLARIDTDISALCQA